MTDLMPLLPCPFCGCHIIKESAVSNTGGYLRYKYCSACHAHGPNVQTPVHSVDDAWNRREAVNASRDVGRYREALREIALYAEDEPACAGIAKAALRDEKAAIGQKEGK